MLHPFFCHRVAAESMCHPHWHGAGHDRTQAPGISSVVPVSMPTSTVLKGPGGVQRGGGVPGEP